MEIKEILESISVISASWAIISGINAWKREYVGKRRIELVQDVLSSFFSLKDAVSYIRNPFSSESDGASFLFDRHGLALLEIFYHSEI